MATVTGCLVFAALAFARADDLATSADLRLDGAAAQDFAGAAVAGDCDTNGDGRDDVVVGAFLADPSERGGAGAAYVIFGGPTRGEADLGALGERGFVIAGAAASDSLGFAVDCAGDVNGDGLDDVIVGAFGTDNNDRSISGSAYVVFGKGDAAPVDLADLGDGGYRIDGEAAGDRAGSAVASAGDVNGDGLDDVLVGANAADPGARSNAGSAYVVHGKRGTAPIDLAALGERGYRIDGELEGDRAGFAVGNAGDVDGDGRPDALVGAYVADANGRDASGSAYVVFGRAGSDPVELSDLGDRGYRIEGAEAGDRFGISATGAGDVNGDGRADLIVGADQSPSDGPGRAHVLFGKGGTAPVDLADRGAGGYSIDGAAAGDLAGFSVDGIGDTNGDGTPDVIVGAYGVDENGRGGSGSAYVVYGKADSTAVALDGIEARESAGFRLDGAAAGDRAGRSVAGAGDFDANGAPDVIVGADRASPRERAGAGAAYLRLSPVAAAPPTAPGPGGSPGDDPSTVPDAGGGPNGSAPTCRGRPATIVGVAGEGPIVGTRGPDVIVGTARRNRILGRGGDDLICGRGGRDIIDGGGGDDRIHGDAGDDLIRGGSGDDALFGNTGDDLIRGGSGDDVLSGGPGADRLGGGGGNDRLRGGRGADRCAGGGRRDFAVGCERRAGFGQDAGSNGPRNQRPTSA